MIPCLFLLFNITLPIYPLVFPCEFSNACSNPVKNAVINLVWFHWIYKSHRCYGHLDYIHSSNLRTQELFSFLYFQNLSLGFYNFHCRDLSCPLLKFIPRYLIFVVTVHVISLITYFLARIFMVCKKHYWLLYMLISYTAIWLNSFISSNSSWQPCMQNHVICKQG